MTAKKNAVKKPEPDGFEDDAVKELLTRTGQGESLLEISADPRMPGRATVYEWIEKDEVFAGQFRAARARGIHSMAEECLEIADTPAEDAVAVADKRLRIDTRLRLAGKWMPSVYGDKVALTGGDPAMGDKPIQQQIEAVVRFIRPGDVPEPA